MLTEVENSNTLGPGRSFQFTAACVLEAKQRKKMEASSKVGVGELGHPTEIIRRWHCPKQEAARVSPESSCHLHCSDIGGD